MKNEYHCGVLNCNNGICLHKELEEVCPYCGCVMIEITTTGFKFCSNASLICDYEVERMGELTDMILDGTLCKECGAMVYQGDPNKARTIEVSPGHPRKCSNCQEEVVEKQEDITLSVTVGKGKYTVQQDRKGMLTALRYGEEWRDCCGDGLILTLAQEVSGLRAKLKSLNESTELED